MRRLLLLLMLVLAISGCDPLYRMRIDVFDEAGLPIQGAKVISVSKEGSPALVFGTTDTKGQIEVGRIGISRLTIEVSKASYRPNRFELELSQEQVVPNQKVILEPIRKPN